MGKLDHVPHVHHFSHPHLLELCRIETQPPSTFSAPCAACKLQPSGYMYTCRPCNFSLHQQCTRLPRLINHPSHPAHRLSLLPTCTYFGGKFGCDACNCPGDGFSFHCTHCNFDLHVLCAYKPLSIFHHLHPPHSLSLTFQPPYGTKGFSCDACGKIGSTQQWLYRCNECEFDVHLDCATLMPKPVAQPLHHHHSFPGAAASAAQTQFQPQVSQPQPALLQHNNSLPVSAAAQTQFQAPPAATVWPSNFMNNAGNGATQGILPHGSGGNTLMNTVVQGLVEGAAQLVGQTLMDGIIGGGSGGGGAGGNGDSSSSSFLDIGSSILGGVFGDSTT